MPAFVPARLLLLYGGLLAPVMQQLIPVRPPSIEDTVAGPRGRTAGESVAGDPADAARRPGLVFIDALKELPATLLLRPIGFDTLPVRILIEASEQTLELAAPSSLLPVPGSLPALWVIMRGSAGR